MLKSIRPEAHLAHVRKQRAGGGGGGANTADSTHSSSSEKTPKLKVTYSSYQVLGRRTTQEDRFAILTLSPDVYLFVVCDGHGGQTCVDFVIRDFPKRVQEAFYDNPKANRIQLLKQCCLETQDAWAQLVLGDASKRLIDNDDDRAKLFKDIDWPTFQKKGYDSGTTLVCALLDLSQPAVYWCHLGDSRALLLAEGCSLRSTTDHGVPVKSEMAHLKGTPQEGKVPVIKGRVKGDINMSGSIGDYDPEKVGCMRMMPEVVREPLSIHKRATMLVASDGLFTDKELQTMLQERFNTAQELVQAFAPYSDNTTLLLVHLEPKQDDESKHTSKDK